MIISKDVNQTLIIRVRAWHKELILPQRLDFVLNHLKSNLKIKFMDIQPIRSLGYYLGYLFSFLLMFPKVIFDRSAYAILENPYLTIFAPFLKLTGKRVISEYVDYYPANLDRLQRTRFFRYLIAKIICKNLHVFSDVITTESETGKRTLMHWGVPEKKIHIIPVGINTQKMVFSQTKRNKIRESLKIDDNTIVVGYLGKFVPYYYLDRIIEAVSLLDKKSDRVTLMFIGDGPERINLEALCKNKNIRSIFTGNVPHTNVASYYSAMDVFIFPLNSLAIKIGEILSIGLPLIVIRGMAEDWIQDGLNGLVSKNNTPIRLKETLSRFLMLSDQEKLKLRQESRHFAETNLSKSIIAKKYISLLRS